MNEVEKTYIAILSIAASLSVLSVLSIILAYILIPHVRSSKIFLYEQLIKSLQAVAIELSFVYSSHQQLCKYFGNLRIFCSLSAFLFSLIYLHQIVTNINSFQIISQDNLKKLTNTKISPFKNLYSLYLFIAFGLPLILIQVPFWANSVKKSNDFCYIYPQEDNIADYQVLNYSLGIILWDLPLLLYIVYSLWISKKTYRFFEPADYPIGLQLVIRRFYGKFLTTLLIILPFTIIYNLQVFSILVPTWIFIITLAILSLWSFTDCIYFWIIMSDIRRQFLQILRIKSIRRSKIMNEQNLVSGISLNNRESGEDFFYTEEEPQMNSQEIQQVQNIILSVNKSPSQSIN